MKYPKEYNFNGARVLNLGCGFAQYKVPNVTNIDAFASCKPDIVWDLNKTPLPLKDNEFDHIIANHIFEHLPNWWGCFEECARVLKPGGKIEIWVPGGGADSIHGFRDHVTEINHCSFYGVVGTRRNLTNAWAYENDESPVNRLKFLRKYLRPQDHKWLRYLPFRLLAFAATHLRNVISENGYEFIKLSDKQYEILNGEMKTAMGQDMAELHGGECAGSK